MVRLFSLAPPPLVFNKIFFPMVDPVIGLILSFALLFAHLFLSAPSAESFSPISAIASVAKKTLVLTLSLMGSATVAIGLLPTTRWWAVGSGPADYPSIIQGMGIGGEWGGALLLAYEYAPEKRKGFSAVFPGRRDHRHADGNLHRLADDPVR